MTTMPPPPITNRRDSDKQIKRFDELKEYKHVPALCDSRRLAHFANWAALNHPGVIMPYNIAFRAIFACARTPAPDSTESKKIKGILSRSKAHLKVEYKRSLITERGIGFRATAHGEEVLKVTSQQTGRRLVSAARAHQSEHDLIDISKIAKTPENQPYLDHYKRSKHLLVQVFEPKMLAAFVYEVPDDKSEPKK